MCVMVMFVYLPMCCFARNWEKVADLDAGINTNFTDIQSARI